MNGHLNNKISERVYQWVATKAGFSGNAVVFPMLIKNGYTHVEFVTETGISLHKSAVPGAEATLGTYATRANNMLREGCDWETAKAPRKSMGPRGTSPHKTNVARIWAESGMVYISVGEALVSVDAELNLTMPDSIGYTHADSVSTAVKLAFGFVQNCVLSESNDWLGKNFTCETWAVAGEYRVSVAKDATVLQAQAALLPLLAANNDYGKLAEVSVVNEGLNDVAIWIEVLKAKAAAHD